MIFVKLLNRFLLWLMGWKTRGRLDDHIKKYLIIIVPHTTNWDFVLGVLTRPLLNLRGAKFLAKKSLFDSPLGFLFYWFGGAPVDRSRKMNLVDQVVEKYQQNERFATTITPEGTRSYVESWRTGFYWIAHKAQIPLVLAHMDYKKREVRIDDELFYTTGKLEEDMQRLYDLYADCVPRYPENSMLHRGRNLKAKPMFSLPLLLLKLAAVIGLVIALLNYELVIYGSRQGWGQLQIMVKAQPVEHFLQDPDFPDSLKQQLYLVADIRSFAFDSLGLDHSKSYTSMYDQKGKPILWVVTACQPYALENKEWHFPVIGTVSYKGFFNKVLAEDEAQSLKAAGWDTRLREVNGWSTLGILRDPILSNMLYRTPGNLAELIIHELTHGTIFVKSNLQLNESLASFIGEEGAILFLQHHYGDSSAEHLEYVNALADHKIFVNYVLGFTQELNALYESFGPEMAVAEKERQKNQAIGKFKAGLFELPIRSERYRNYFERLEPNNAFFMAYVRYRGSLNEFEEDYQHRFAGDMPGYIRHLKAQYPSIF